MSLSYDNSNRDNKYPEFHPLNLHPSAREYYNVPTQTQTQIDSQGDDYIANPNEAIYEARQQDLQGMINAVADEDEQVPYAGSGGISLDDEHDQVPMSVPNQPPIIRYSRATPDERLDYQRRTEFARVLSEQQGGQSLVGSVVSSAVGLGSIALSSVRGQNVLVTTIAAGAAINSVNTISNSLQSAYNQISRYFSNSGQELPPAPQISLPVETISSEPQISSQGSTTSESAPDIQLPWSSRTTDTKYPSFPYQSLVSISRPGLSYTQRQDDSDFRKSTPSDPRPIVPIVHEMTESKNQTITIVNTGPEQSFLSKWKTLIQLIVFGALAYGFWPEIKGAVLSIAKLLGIKSLTLALLATGRKKKNRR